MARPTVRRDAAAVWRRNIRAALATAGLLCLLIAPAPVLAASAGLKPSQAPLVAVGEHYFGNVDHEANAGGDATADIWHLPPLLISDAVTIAWNANGRWPPTLCLAQDVDDYSWADNNNWCNGSDRYEISGSGSSRAVMQVKGATSNAFLEFWGCTCYGSSPYDFTIESIQHAIGVGLNRVPRRIKPHSRLTASASLSDGSPVPDGLAFTLTARWVTPVNKASHHRRYRAESSGGVLTFRLRLPRSARRKRVSLVVARPTDAGYLAAKSIRVTARVPSNHRRHHRRHQQQQ